MSSEDMKSPARMFSHVGDSDATAEWLERDRYLASMHFFPVQIDPEAGTVLMAELSRDEMKAMPFHNRRLATRNRKFWRVKLDTLLNWLPPDRPLSAPAHYIFHNAYCGSTLLARCLDIPGNTLAYREPSTLATLGDRWHQNAADPVRWQQLTAALLRLLQRRSQAEQTVIKLNDRSNNMIVTLLELHPENRGIILHSGLRAFLVAVLGKPVRREWLRERCALGCAELPDTTTLPSLPVSRDGEAAARYWLAQMLFFSAALERYPGRMLPLRSDVFLRDPQSGAKQAADFLGLAIPDEMLVANIATERLTHAKMGRPYQPHEAALTKALLEKNFGAEIDQARQWLLALVEQNKLRLSIFEGSGNP